ncbi:DUF58 domain-containing protein [Paenibacillus lentus]|uniref:DUF58 domain-containing protein n=1 Tax=Paenibacillus lentus TaxID=1338368 RepID=A0A3Q8SB81_9BACL|nr:DUF58 domain-containing protein [Paenibacillus lentus]AZK46754.1 DUF58 domain-containing protein [Paenibacillus lentus]
MRALLNTWRSSLRSLKLWRMASLWLICLLYLLFQGGKTSFMLFAMVTLLAGYWLLGSLVGIRQIKGNRTMLSLEGEQFLLQAGDQAQIKLHLQLPRLMPMPYIIVREVMKRHNGDSWAFEDSVVPQVRGEAELVYNTPALERGKYEFVSTECTSEDIFGLMEHRGTFQAGGQFCVLPRTVFIPHWQLYSRNSRLPGPETAMSNSRRETTQINGVRDYVYGDRISRIHWNATARTGTWKSKEFEHESLPKTVLVLDAHKSSYASSQQFELAVSVSASLLEYGSRERINMGLCTMGRELRRFTPAEGYIERQQMIHHLVDIDVDGDGSHRGRLEEIRDFFPAGSFFIFISPLADETAMSVLNWAKTRQMTPYQIEVGVSAQGKTTRSYWQSVLHNQGIRAVHISSLQDLPIAMGGGLA